MERTERRKKTKRAGPARDGNPKGKPVIRGVEHIAIATDNPKRLAQWYVDELSFEPLLDTGTTIYLRSANCVVLEFVLADNIPPKPAIRDAGLRHIGFSVDNLETAYAKLKAAGVQFESAPVVLPGMRLFFFRDPEGNYLHLVQRDEKLIS